MGGLPRIEQGWFTDRSKSGRPTTDQVTRLAFTTREVQRLTALSSRRIQYWDETDFIRPSIAARKGRGSPRLYSFKDLVQLRVAAELRHQLSLQALRRLKAALDVDAPFAEVRFLATASKEVVYVGPSGQHEAAKFPGQIVMTIDVPLTEIRGDLSRKIELMRQRQGVGRVSRAKGVVAGKERIAGTRITAAAVGRLLDAGWSQRQILDEYPDLRADDIRNARRKRAG